MHQVKRPSSLKKSKRVGRGGKRGTYSGRGIKGQKARSGRKMEPAIRQSIKRYPKIRGYQFKPRRQKPVILNLRDLEGKFSDGAEINPRELLKKGIIEKIKGRLPKVKILGSGDITKKINIRGCLLSKKAKEKIEKVGGKVLK